MPYLEQLGFGGLAGFAVGLALKKLAMFTAILVGLLFICIQLLAYHGFLTVNPHVLKEIGEPGPQETSFVAAALAYLKAVLLHNIPFGGAFTAGLVMGLKKG
jgi:uncharacterized membrane protein (Fun14 family)